MWKVSLNVEGFFFFCPPLVRNQEAVNSLIKRDRQNGTTLLFTVSGWTVISNQTSKQQNWANCANTMAATSKNICFKNRNVSISRTAQVDNDFLGDKSTVAWGWVEKANRDAQQVSLDHHGPGGFFTLFHTRFQLRCNALFPRVGQRLLYSA